jgi:phage portal protein BeeE
VLYRRPNPWQTSFEYRETIATAPVLTGNALQLHQPAARRHHELIPLQPQFVRSSATAQGYIAAYEVTRSAGSQGRSRPRRSGTCAARAGTAGRGLEAVYLAREAIGLAMATEETHAKLHANGVRPSGTYSVEGTLNRHAVQAAARSGSKSSTPGVENAGTPMILDRGAKWLRRR